MVTPQLGVTVISSVKKKLIKLFCFVLFFSFWRCFPWSLPVGGGWGGGEERKIFIAEYKNTI